MGQLFGRDAEASLRARLLIATAAAAIAGLPCAVQAAPPSCKSITKGTLDVELPASQRSSRMVRLAKGEIVNFSIHSGASGATVTLVSGGAPQTLHAPNSGGMASFTAPDTATYVFVIEAGRDNMTSVTASCTQVGGAEAEATSPSRQDVQLAQIETDEEGLSRRCAFSLGLSEFAATAKAAGSPLNQWIGDSTAAPAIDTAGSDDDAASAATLSFSTNAEIGPDDLTGVLARMGRLNGNEGAADAQTQTAMTWSAILAPGLTFVPEASVKTASSVKRPPQKGTQVAAAQPEAPVEEWWVTHLQDSRETEAPATETAVLRRDAVASNSFQTPPMALGGFIPPPDVLPASQP